MSTGVVAAGAAAVALYVYLKQKGLQDGEMDPVLPVEACRDTDHAPSNWSEALYHVKEVLRYMYNETLGRWHTIDLFVGLAYLSHREVPEYPALDIAAKGAPVDSGLGTSDQLRLLLELQEARRYMLYCKGLKLRREEMQVRFWKEHLGADTLTIVKQQPTAGVLRPAYVLVSDRALQAVVLCIRGTHSMKDLFTSLAGAAKPHHVVDPGGGGLVLGYSHLGMLAAARWLARQVTPLLRLALEANPGYSLRVVGHSMGGGTAALLTMMLRGGYGGPAPAPAAPAAASCGGGGTDPLREARCYSIACPSVVTLELAAACREYVTSIVNGTDIVPTFCAASVDRLREDVTRSSWFSEFSRDMRSGVLRALQGGVRGVGSATQWTSRNILQPAVVPFRACYATTATRRTKRRAAATSALTGAAAGSSAANMAIAAAAAAAEQREQLLLAAGAGGGAAVAAAAAAAAAAVDDGGGAAGPGCVPCTPAAMFAAMSGAGSRPVPQSMGSGLPGQLGSAGGSASLSGASQHGEDGGAGARLDERAMAEAVQSCMYAVGTAVSSQGDAGHSPADPAIMEALGLLDSLPPELGPGPGAGPTGAGRAAGRAGRGGHGSHAGSRQQSGGGAAAAAAQGGAAGASPGGAEPAASLLTGVGAAVSVFGSGGVSTALSYGTSLRRRLWPWGQAAQGAQGAAGPSAWGQGVADEDDADASLGISGSGSSFSAPQPGSVRGGCLPTSVPAGIAGSASAAALADASDRRSGAGAGAGAGEIMTPPHLIAFDSPGKAKAAAAATGPGGGGGGAVPSSSGRGLGDWLWRGGGMLFTSCTAPRRALPAGQGQRGPGSGLVLGLGAASAGRLADAAAGRRPLRVDVGAGYDDESDDALEDGGEDEDGGEEEEGEHEGLLSEEADLEEEEEEGEGGSGAHGARRGGGGAGRSAHLAGGTAASSEQQLQAGITAVVAAVTNQASRDAPGPGGLMRDDAARDAEAVLREVADGEAEAEGEGGHGDAGAALPAARPRRARRAGGGGGSDAGTGRTVTRRSRRSMGAASSTGGGGALRSASVPHDVEALGGGANGGAGTAAAPPGSSAAAAARGLARAVSELVTGGGGGGSGGRGFEQDDEGIMSPLSPGDVGGGGGSPVGSPPAGGGGGRAGRSAEYEARLYKRKLYPAGRILHLFPAAAVTSLRPQRQQADEEACNDSGGGSGGGGVGGGGSGVSTTAAAASTTPADAAAVQSSAAQAPYVLYEVPDPTAYSRVRLCRTMVSDHLIPAYLTALESVIGALGEEQQRAAREAWEREQGCEQELERE